ncbi:ATP-binding cassette domain-containing protein [Spiroplasma tabanidicola]|uniref:ATP-binding cassette domain-containing protein n=1 Tax=Spiroplasma tabanidicola TaxID=324079 RepID=UPI0012DF9FFA|nr:ATP-binding cassette domain-containing protein [Spiroplasma tabanidicola]
MLNLSGGERQRLSIIRGLIVNKEWLFLDEITSALDEKTAFKVLDIFLKDKNKTIIMVAHKLDQNIVKQFNKVVKL